MNVLGFSVHGTNHGHRVILCPREVHQFRRSWVNDFRRSLVDNFRCAPPSFLMGSMMLLSVNLPHRGRNDVDFIEALEGVRATFVEGKRMGAVEFFIGGDLNIE